MLKYFYNDIYKIFLSNYVYFKFLEKKHDNFLNISFFSNL